MSTLAPVPGRVLPRHCQMWWFGGFVACWPSLLIGCFRAGFVSLPGTEDAGAAVPVDAACVAAAPVDVQNDRTPPTVRLTSPAPAAEVAGDLELCAAADDDVALSGVRFWLGATLLGAEDATAPFCHTLDTRTLPDGAYVVTAVARDAAAHETRASATLHAANGNVVRGVAHHVCDCAAGADPDCVAGSDSADGLQPSTPRQSSAAAQGLLDHLACGDALLFCAGGAVEATASYRPPPLDCALAPVHLGAYRPPWASGDEAAPTLIQAASEHGIEVDSDTGPRRGLVVEDLHLRCDGCNRGSVSSGLWSTGNQVSSLWLRRCEIEGFTYGVYASQAAALTIAYSFIHHARTGGIAVGGRDLAVLHNRFEHNGCIGAAADDACAGDWSLFVGVTLRDSSTQIIGNEITRTAVDSQGKCRGVALQVNGGGYGARIEHNYIHEPVDAIREGCGGIQAIANPDTAIGYCVGCSIQGNRIENSASGIVIAAHQGSLIASNTIALPAAASSWTPCAALIIHRRLDSLDIETTQIRALNNSISISRDDPSCTAVHVEGEGTDHVVANNAILYDGHADAFDCFRYDDPSRLTRADHNLCHVASATGARWIATGATRMDLVTWQDTGHDAASTDAQPGFVGASPPLYSFAPLACDRSLLDLGDDALCPTTDLGGRPRPAGAACDLGAFER